MSNAATYKISESDQLLQSIGSNKVSGADGSLGALQTEAATRFKRLGVPTMKQEEWRFLSLKPLAETHFALPVSGADAAPQVELAESRGFLGLSEITAVFVNGYYNANLSNLDNVPTGITVKPISDGAASLPEFQDNIGQVAIDQEHPFMALNTAMFSDGLFVHIPANTVLSSPINIVYLATETSEPTIINPRLLVVAETSSQASVIETFIGPDDLPYFVNPVSEFVVADNAILDHYRNQFDGHDAFHFATLDARQGRTSKFSTQTFTFGGRITRNDTGLHMDGDGGHGTMNGLYHIDQNQVVDNHTRIDHAFPNCETHELFKGVLDDHARGVFNGRILVRQIAQKTDSKQTNRTLLLSSDALINTNPQLEIFADDVKCTHGATVGQLDETQLYYLRSRGISEDEARRLLVFAFANDVVEKVEYTPLRTLLEHRLLATQEAKAALAKA